MMVDNVWIPTLVFPLDASQFLWRDESKLRASNNDFSSKDPLRSSFFCLYPQEFDLHQFISKFQSNKTEFVWPLAPTIDSQHSPCWYCFGEIFEVNISINLMVPMLLTCLEIWNVSRPKSWHKKFDPTDFCQNRCQLRILIQV